MASVSALSYIGFLSQDLDEWRRFGEGILGMQVSDESDEQVLHFRLDERARRISVSLGAEGLDYLGFEVASRAELQELTAVLGAAGFPAKEDASLAEVRRVHQLVRTEDPAGNPIELVVGPLTSTAPFASPLGVRFSTGEQGLGHAFLSVLDEASAWHFYVDLLGFRLTDTIDMRDGEATFLHCNPRHHSVGYAPFGFSGLQHIMIEVNDLDPVGRAYDLVQERGIPVTMTLGKHTNDQMVSFYVRTPSGFELEYGTNGLAVDDATWTVGHYDSISFWGHKFSAPPKE